MQVQRKRQKSCGRFFLLFFNGSFSLSYGKLFNDNSLKKAKNEFWRKKIKIDFAGSPRNEDLIMIDTNIPLKIWQL